MHVYMCMHIPTLQPSHGDRGLLLCGRSTEEGVMNIQLDLSPAIKAQSGRVTSWPHKSWRIGIQVQILLCIVLSP